MVSIITALFRIIGFLEGLSYLLLILIAVPVKYIFNSPSMVKYLGMPHGILFIMYLLVSVIMKKTINGLRIILFSFLLLLLYLLVHL